MANIIRKNQKVFAENAVNNGQFGSLQDTTKVLTQDLDILQANPAYELGWNNATISGEKLPALEEFQSLNYINTSQITYLLNKGIPEWVVDAEYYIGDIQREVAGTKIYRSITNNNIGNILTNITHWVLLGDLANLASNILFNQQIIIANNIADPNNDINFSAGNFIFSDFSGQAVASAMTKRLDASWVAGTNQGGLFSGTKAANTTYHLFAIYDPVNNLTDFGFSTSLIAADRPVAYTKFKRIASLLTNVSLNIREGIYTFNNDGSYSFYYKTPINDYSSTGSLAGALIPLTIPTGISVLALLFLGCSDSRVSNHAVYLTNPAVSNDLPTLSLSTLLLGQGNSPTDGGAQAQVITNTTSQIRLRSNSLSGVTNISTLGYTDYSIL
jgi:hypothetical protein